MVEPADMKEKCAPKRAMTMPSRTWLWRCRLQPRPSNIEEHQAAPDYAMAMGLSRSATCNFRPGLFASSRSTEGLCRPSTTEPAELSVSDERHRTPLFSSELFSSELKSPAERGGSLPSSEDVPQGVSGLGSRAIACLLDVSTEIDFLVGEMTVVAATLVTIRCDSGEPREGPGVEDDDEDATLPAELGEAAGV